MLHQEPSIEKVEANQQVSFVVIINESSVEVKEEKK